MLPLTISANTIDEAWFCAIRGLLTKFDKDLPDYKHEYTIDKGSWAGSKRVEYDHITIVINYPSTRPLSPVVPEGVTPPTTEDKIEEYFNRYLLSDIKECEEQYTYGERIVISIDKVIESITKTPMSNQIILQVAEPGDIFLEDPPCLRHIDIRVIDNTVHFLPYFRSWDLYAGFPQNLGGIQLLKEYVCRQADKKDGKIIATSKGLHLYDYQLKQAKERLGINEDKGDIQY